MRCQRTIGVTLLVTAIAGCNWGPHSPVGFRLPEGNVEQGRAAFVKLKCHSCHRVSGVDLPPPTGELSSPLTLGGEVYEVRTDGYLVTSVIHPSHKLARGYPKEQIAVGKESRMPRYGDRMTVQELVDLVAFLQSRYRVLPPTYLSMKLGRKILRREDGGPKHSS